MLARRPVLLTLMAVAMVVPLAAPALAHDTGAHAARAALMQPPSDTARSAEAMEHVANLQYEPLPGGGGQSGSDIEFLKLGAKEYALAGTLRNGMQVIDITDPRNPSVAGVYDCAITQGDIQVFRQGDRVLATYTADSAIAPTDGEGTRSELNEARFGAQCVQEAIDLGTELTGDELGTFLVDITDPTQPSTVGFLEVPEGSHNQTVHPSGDYLYNSNSDLLGVGGLPEITIHDISDPAEPRKVQDFTFPPIPTSLGTESHDIFFNGEGTRAYAAALSSTLVLDTTDPEDPKIISQFADPSNNVVHQSDLVSLPREDGSMRDLLIVTDEQVGAAGNGACPGGGLHVYDITGDKETDPLANKLGTWFIDSMAPTTGACTSHVLRIHPDQQMLTIAWYTAGVRTLDISGLAEFDGLDPAAVGEGVGLTEVGHFVFPDADVWSFKTNRIATDGSFFGYGNDLLRGFDVYEFDGPLVDDRTVPALEPEDLAPQGAASNCDGVPVASAYVDRDQAREVHKRSIDCVIARSIAQGSVRDGQKVYRPLEDVTRGQMATFILNTLRASGQDTELPEPKADAFDDIDESIHREAIATLAAANIVQGTSGGTSYAPLAPVSREQMASFMVRAAQFAVEPDLVESGARRFTDVPDGGVHSDAIAIGDDNRLFQGTTATTFAPKVQVKRDQMATFLTRLLTVAGGGSATPSSGTSTQP